MSDTKQCYIRRDNSHWMAGKPHHKAALELYLNTEGEPGEDSQEKEIQTQHPSGGMFKATFSRITENLYKYVDEYQNTVKIMMAEPEQVAYINRLRD